MKVILLLTLFATQDGAAIWQKLVAGNQHFAKQHAKERKQLKSAQHPHTIVLTCSDSRVPPELLFEQSLGDLFVIRVAGNTADPQALGSIEYAIEHLRAPLLVVLGHEKCGAVAAAQSGAPMTSANLEAVVDDIRPAIAGATDLDDAVIANVHRATSDLTAHSSIVREHLEHKKLTIVKAIYRFRSGTVETLK